MADLVVVDTEGRLTTSAQIRAFRLSDNFVYDFQGAVKAFKPRTGTGTLANAAHSLSDAVNVDDFGEVIFTLPDDVDDENCRIHVVSGGNIKISGRKDKGQSHVYNPGMVPILDNNIRVSQR